MKVNRLYWIFAIAVAFILQNISATGNVWSATPTYADNSVLSHGDFYKIQVKNSGIYKLTFEDLKFMNLEPENVRVFGYGGGVLEEDLSLLSVDDLPEVAIWMEKGADNIFNAGDYILFYAQGVVRWTYDKDMGMFTHKNNPYANYGYYFITSDAGVGKRMEEKSITVPMNALVRTVDEFIDYQVHERDLVSLVHAGKEFYGETFDETLSYNFSFEFPNIVIDSASTVRINVISENKNTPNASFSLNLNGRPEKIIEVNKVSSDYYEKGKDATAMLDFQPTGDNLDFTLTYNMPNPRAKGYLNYLTVNARRKLIMSGSVMQFQNVDYLDSNSYNQFLLSNADEIVQILDVTDQANISPLKSERIYGKIRFVDFAKELRHYIAVNPKVGSVFPTPEIVGKVSNQNLHGIAQADYVILTHPDFLAPAERLAEAHRQKDQMSVAVVTTEQVFNEFSSGTPDATAYRRMMKMLYDRAIESGSTDAQPKYLLLFGKGSFDNRQILQNSGFSKHNFILTYQADNSLNDFYAYTTDDYFPFLKDQDGSNISRHKLDIAVGRFPVTTVKEAYDVVNKTIRYMENNDKGKWKSQMSFIGDDRAGNLFMKITDNLTILMQELNPEYHINKLYVDDFPVENVPPGNVFVPLLKDKLLEQVNSGVFYLNYTGTGTSVQWSFKRILENDDIAALNNTNLPLWMAATADFATFDRGLTSMGEHVILNPNGGGIGALGATRTTYASQNEKLNRYFIENLFSKKDGKYLRVGDALKNAKNQISYEINKLTFVYLGDPAIRLNYGDEYQVQTVKLNDLQEFLGTDTIRANSTNTISGKISDENDTLKSNFFGELYFTIYSKPENKVTLYNNPFDTPYPFEYQDRNIVLEGTTEVINGLFEFTFTLPYEISEEFGDGLIRYYAVDNQNDMEAQGVFDKFTIGGSVIGANVDLITVAEKELLVSNYPNPAREMVHFKIVGNNNVQSFGIDIFDLSGRKVQSFSSKNQNQIIWDLTNSYGAKVKAGTYFYQAKVKTIDQEIVNSGKIIVIN